MTLIELMLLVQEMTIQQAKVALDEIVDDPTVTKHILACMKERESGFYGIDGKTYIVVDKTYIVVDKETRQ